MKNSFFTAIFLFATLSINAQTADVVPLTGPFSPSWESLNKWECPEWFKDAKFGIWAHWGPQCYPEDGDWYARHMYYEGQGQHNFHVEHYGDPSVYGLKEICRDWKAEHWNPDSLVAFYKSVGARYFMTLANHHDNFDLWNSPFQRWNSVLIGPKKDIVGGWKSACDKVGLPLCVSIHSSHAWTWLEGSQQFDGNLTYEDGFKPNADGTEKWWKGLDPQALYAQNHPHSKGWEKPGNIHSQWAWGNGASLPSESYKKNFQNRVLQLVNDYDPKMIYFDDTVLPFYGCDETIGLNIASHFYNHSAAKNNGQQQVIVTGKVLDDWQKDAIMWDVERGIPDRVQEKYWQTCTCIGQWHYNRSVYERNSYKSGATVVRMLTDIISKNGNLLLSVPVRADGTIDEREVKVLNDIKAWMDINSEAIYGTRVWQIFGEGPVAEDSNPIKAQGFNEGQHYSSRDIRYVQKNGNVYATIMAWPTENTTTLKAFGSLAIDRKVKSVYLLGYGKVDFKQKTDGLHVVLPTTHPNEIAPVLRISLKK
ncbi:MAG: alpha-L-fucosidase [Prevotellaceae bacterium]|nr:alpha-L-fucosidase [Prevotellaceae bacterium]